MIIALSLPGINQGDFRTDSHVYVAATLEMLRSGDFIHPMQGNVPYHNKPPLGFWLAAPFIAALGPTLLAVRLAMTLIAALCALAVTGLARELVPARIALTTGLVFALTHEVFRYTHAFSLDLPLVLMMVLSAWCVVRAARPRGQRARSGWWVVLGGAPMGLALLIKPLLALVLLAPLGVWLVMARRAKLLAWLPALVAVAAAVALPWHIAMWRAYPAESLTPFIDTYLLSQAVDRLSGDSAHVSEPWWYYLSELGRTYLPWVVLLVGGLAWLVIRRRSITGRRAADALGLLWGGFWLLMMTGSAGKSMRYLVPIYPALSLLVAGVLVRTPPRGRLTPIVLPWVVAAGAVAVAIVNPKIHAPPPPSRAELIAYIETNNAPGRPVWIAPDQLRTAAHLSITMGEHPLVAVSETTPTGGTPEIGDLMLYRVKGVYAPREGDAVLGEYGVWLVTRIGRDWDGAYTKR